MRTIGLSVAAVGANSSGYAWAAHHYGHIAFTASAIVWFVGAALFGAGVAIIEHAAKK